MDSSEQYLLAALIEIYRGSTVPLPETNPDLENNLLRDVFSTAISFARFDESRRVLSEEIFRSNNEGATVRDEVNRVREQTPDVLNAKMVAAAHLMQVYNPSSIRLS